MPLRFLGVLHQKALVVPHGYSYSFTIRPNDLREDRLPRDITESVHWLVSTRHRSRKRRPFSRYAARRRLNSVYRDKSMNLSGGDSKVIEEKLDQVTDLKIQIRGLISDNEEVKLNQEEINANMTFIAHQMTLITEALGNIGGSGGASAAAAEKQRKGSYISCSSLAPPAPTPTPTPTSANGKKQRKASIEGAVKQLTDFAVSLSVNDASELKRASSNSTSEVDERNTGGESSKLKRTNMMKRRESQALLEGVRKHRSQIMMNNNPNS